MLQTQCCAEHKLSIRGNVAWWGETGPWSLAALDCPSHLTRYMNSSELIPGRSLGLLVYGMGIAVSTLWSLGENHDDVQCRALPLVS